MKTRNGYIAISAVLIISAVTLIIGTSVSLLSINDIQSALSNSKSRMALNLIEGCAEYSLRRLGEDNTVASSITTPLGTCSVTINSHTGNNWTFTVSGTIGGYTKSVQISAVRGVSVSITNWLEV